MSNIYIPQGMTLSIVRAYSRNLGQRLILAELFYESALFSFFFCAVFGFDYIFGVSSSHKVFKCIGSTVFLFFYPLFVSICADWVLLKVCIVFRICQAIIAYERTDYKKEML